MALSYNDFNFLSKVARDKIISETFLEIESGVCQPHSYQTITKEGRDFSIGARMISTSTDNWEIYILKNGKIIPTGSYKSFTGKMIADIFVDSVNRYGKTYYPLTGDFTKIEGLNQLVIFVKDRTRNKYLPYARFIISEIIKQDQLSIQQATFVTDITPIIHYEFKTLLELKEVETQNLPLDFLGNTSGVGVYQRAFKGCSSNILMI